MGAVTALGLGFVVVGLGALVLSDDPVSVGLYVTSFVAPIGAGGGIVAGYTMDDSETIKYVGSPGDLRGIGMGIVKCTRDIGAGVDDCLRLSVLSLSTLLRYTNADRMATSCTP